jgi:hypothetical protein
VAGTTTISENWQNNSDYTTFHLGSQELQQLLASGFPASLITTILGSLIFRIAAAKNPIGFISHPIINPAIRICLVVENTGVMQFSWVLSKLFINLFRFRLDSSFPLTSHGNVSSDLETGALPAELAAGSDAGPSGADGSQSPVKRRGNTPLADQADGSRSRSGSAPGTPLASSSGRGIEDEGNSMYRSIFAGTPEGGDSSALLTVSIPGGGGGGGDDSRLSGLSPPVRERGASMQQTFAAAMMTTPVGVGAAAGAEDHAWAEADSPLHARANSSAFTYSLPPEEGEDADTATEKDTY